MFASWAGGRPSTSESVALGAGLLLAAAGVLLAPPEGFWITDNSVRFIQLQDLARSDTPWLEWGGEAIDPGLDYAPIEPPVAHHRDGHLYVGFSPFFVRLVYPFHALGGLTLVRWSMLLWLAALLFGVRALTRVIAPRRALADVASPISIALTGLASPIPFYALSLWEHVPAAALITWALVGWVRAERGRGIRDAAIAGASFGLAIYLRDGLYVALLPATGLLAVRRPQRWRVTGAFLGASLIALVPAWAANLAWFGDPLGLHLRSDSPLVRGWGPHLLERLHVAEALFANLSPDAFVSLGLALPLLLVAVARPAARPRQLRLWLPALATAGTLVAVVVARGWLTSEAGLRGWLVESNGLFAAAPWIVLGSISVTRSASDDDVPRSGREHPLWIFVLGYFALYAFASPSRLAVGLHWGCRYLLEVIPLLAALVGLNVARWWEQGGNRQLGVVALGAVALLSLGLQLGAMRLQIRRRTFSRELNRLVLDRPEGAVVSDWWSIPQELGHVFFEKPIFLIAPESDRDRLRRLLREAGHESVVFVAPRPPTAPGVEHVQDPLGGGPVGVTRMSTR